MVRPTAYELSFPNDAVAAKSLPTPRPTPGPSRQNSARPTLASTQSRQASTSVRTKKRPSSEGDNGRKAAAKRQRKSTRYVLPSDVLEEEDLFFDCEFDDEVEDLGKNEDEKKPVRTLQDFTVFDPSEGNMLSLALLEEGGHNHSFEATGYVTAMNEEPEDLEETDSEGEGPKLVHLGAILRFYYNCSEVDGGIWIDTIHAWYILGRASSVYEDIYHEFLRPRRVAQIAVCHALSPQRRQTSREDFIEMLNSKLEPLGITYQLEDLQGDVAEEIMGYMEETNSDNIQRLPFIRWILEKKFSSTRGSTSIRNPRFAPPQTVKAMMISRSIDLQVLRNPNPTQVTPRIAALAHGHFRESLHVVGPKLPMPNADEIQRGKAEALIQLRQWMRHAVANGKKKVLDYQQSYTVIRGSQYLKKIKVYHDKTNCEHFSIGDVVLSPIDKPETWNREVDEDLTVQEVFWFGKIKHINFKSEKVHVQWMYHGEQTVLGELAPRQQLFLSKQCGAADVRTLGGKVILRESSEGLLPGQFFCDSMYDHETGAFETIDPMYTSLTEFPPPENCESCLMKEQRDQDSTLVLNRKEAAMILRGSAYHPQDFVLYRPPATDVEGPALIGRIIDIVVPSRKQPTVLLEKVGRISDIDEKILSQLDEIKDERQVFLTDETENIVDLDRLIRICFVATKDINHLEHWLSLSSDNFCVKYKFPSLIVRTPSQAQLITELLLDETAARRIALDISTSIRFEEYSKKNTLPTLDLFGGVGAFGLSLAQGSGCLNITHAIEIAPSAAATYERNSPNTTVYNQCANTVLQYFVKRYHGHDVQTPTRISDNTTPLPEPIVPGQIKVLVAGFPCQPHSRLNRYKNNTDLKANLLATTVSFVDFLKPDFCYLENVEGFLSYQLNSERRGLSWLLSTLIDMKYQVRFGLMDAGQHGAPQARRRFFLVAARHKFPLPLWPQITHAFPTKDLKIKFPTANENIAVINAPMERGTAPLRSITIKDAIGDLPLFDWEHPKDPIKQRQQMRKDKRQDVQVCGPQDWFIGPSGPPKYAYDSPRTSFQREVRANPTLDLQHFTRIFASPKIIQVLAIPLRPNADYRDLPDHLKTYMLSNPNSSLGRRQFPPGAFTRLDESSHFGTTVGNMEPTAKQSKVLHPNCHRMVTVRELARSQGFPDNFCFVTVNNSVVGMHRQIGNAVAWPVGRALGKELRAALLKKWQEDSEHAIEID
ncbi:S-adenosyl-L-methionine-dependent methyltransferase [Mycena floridula]|nr:S-adenosyl-L-methionine-dependent methyltransferase [Mycena floridula]